MAVAKLRDSGGLPYCNSEEFRNGEQWLDSRLNLEIEMDQSH